MPVLRAPKEFLPLAMGWQISSAISPRSKHSWALAALKSGWSQQQQQNYSKRGRNRKKRVDKQRRVAYTQRSERLPVGIGMYACVHACVRVCLCAIVLVVFVAVLLHTIVWYVLCTFNTSSCLTAWLPTESRRCCCWFFIFILCWLFVRFFFFSFCVFLKFKNMKSKTRKMN